MPPGWLKKKPNDPTKARMDEIEPIAREVMQAILDGNLPLGEDKSDEAIRKYDITTKRVLEMLLRHDIKYVDKDFLFQLVLQPFDRIREVVNVSLKKSLDLALDKVMGKDFREIRLFDLDRVLTRHAQKNPDAS